MKEDKIDENTIKLLTPLVDTSEYESDAKKLKLDLNKADNITLQEDSVIRICKYVLEKKKCRFKFNALRNLDYCVAHLTTFNDQVNF